SAKRAAVKRPPSGQVPTVKTLLERVPPRQRVWWAVGAAVLVLAAVALVLWFALRPGRGSAQAPLRTPVTLHVGRASRLGALDSVKRALYLARPGDRIVLLDDTEEPGPLIWEGIDGGKDVTIEGANEKIVWRLQKPADDDRFVVLTNVSGLHLRG